MIVLKLSLHDVKWNGKYRTADSLLQFSFCETRLLWGCVEIVGKVPTTKFVLKISVSLSNQQQITKVMCWKTNFIFWKILCWFYFFDNVQAIWVCFITASSSSKRDSITYILCQRWWNSGKFFKVLYSILREAEVQSNESNDILCFMFQLISIIYSFIHW